MRQTERDLLRNAGPYEAVAQPTEAWDHGGVGFVIVVRVLDRPLGRAQAIELADLIETVLNEAADGGLVQQQAGYDAMMDRARKVREGAD